MSGQRAAFLLSDVDAAEKLRVISALSERSAKSCAFNRPPNAMAPSKKAEPGLALYTFTASNQLSGVTTSHKGLQRFIRQNRDYGKTLDSPYAMELLAKSRYHLIGSRPCDH